MPRPVHMPMIMPPDAGTPARKPRVCFSLLFAEQLLNGSGGYFGGAEVRGVTFLRGIAQDQALDVHVMVVGHAVPRPSCMRPDGITVHYRPDACFYQGNQDDVRQSVWAQVYVAFGANAATAELARFCTAHGSALVVSVASDLSLAPFVHEFSTIADPYGVPGHFIWHGMRHADELVVQTEHQRERVRTCVQREATLIRNPTPSGVLTAPRMAPRYGGRMLWIGCIDPNKRHQEALILAAASPHRPMIMVCNNIHTLGAGVINELQQQLPNLVLADQVALPDIDALFRFSDVLVNTSVVEGFPNTFLQAGMHGIPVVSMVVDPDGMLTTCGCGRVSDDTRNGMAQTVEMLLQSKPAYAAAAAANAGWLRSRHDPAGRIEELSVVVHRALALRARRAVAHVS